MCVCVCVCDTVYVILFVTNILYLTFFVPGGDLSGRNVLPLSTDFAVCSFMNQ